ncbi:hypothetical protein [Rouxiella badensis]|uniref:hypothetical protein n=1 Tax=Rouxiella badensis TaxID=1646377 RepID=UPI0017882B05|nr:hypothetical protein [Rouxiella badensis]QOI57935.1 hypothetical protein H2866_22835 [Rouxiella badensis subsp. acadiensis]
MIKASEENLNAQDNRSNDRRYSELAALANELPALGVHCASTTNRARAALAAQALTRFASDTGEPLRDIVTDLLANMMHLFHVFELDGGELQRLLEIATGHFEAELDEE